MGDNITEFDISAIDGWSSRQHILTGKKFSSLINYQIQQKLSERIASENGNVDDEFILVRVTFESENEAINMVKMLTYNKLIGSAQIYPLNTSYMWDTKLCNESEHELSCITKRNLYSQVETFINNHHSYGVCQIIAVPVIYSSVPFGNWIKLLTDI